MNATLAIDQLGFPILGVMIIFPLIIIGSLYLLRSRAHQQFAAYFGVIAGLGLALLAYASFDAGGASTQLVQKSQWMSALGAELHLGVDGIGAIFLPLTALVILLAMLSGAGVPSASRRWYYSNLLLLQSAATGVFASLDLVLFFLFWEIMLIPSYFLIRQFGVGPKRAVVAMKYVLYMLIGSVPLLVAFALLGANFGTFDLTVLAGMEIGGELQAMLFALLFLGFAIKAPLPPFHTWLPSVAMEGPGAIAIFLMGLKLGTFGMIKILLPLAPDIIVVWQPYLLWYGVLAMLYGGLIALAQQNMRRMLAYASVSHVGIVVAGIFALNISGVQGAVLAMVNMAMAVSVMMLLAGVIYQRLGSSELNRMGGLARHGPLLAVAFFIAGLASMGMPGTSGFQGEFAILLGVFDASPLIGAAALLGVILGAGYVLWFYERAFFGPVKSDHIKRFRDLGRGEGMAVGLVIVLIILIGLMPMPVIRTIHSSIEPIASLYEGASLQPSRLNLAANLPDLP